MSGRVLIAAGSVEAAKPFESILHPAGFDTAIATRPDDVLALCRRGACDLVILDGRMPGGDALGLCRSVKAAAPGVMVLLVSAAGEPGQRLAALEAGADETLSWPASPSTLILRAHSLAAASALAGEAARMRALKGLDPDMPPQGPARILIVDPCDRSRSRLTDILSALGAVTAFEDPAAGLVAAAAAQPDLALVSLEWSDRAGADLVRQLRLVASEKELSILAIADDGTPARLCLDVGLQDRLLRPIDRCEALVRARLALKKAAISASLHGFTAEAPIPAMHRLTRGGRREPPARFAA